MKKVLYTLGTLGTLALPLVSLAQGTGALINQPGIGPIARLFQAFLNYASPILISVAVVWFLYGVIAYVITGDAEKKENAKSTMIYGIIGIFVMVSVFGIVKLLQDTFGVGQQQTIPAPVLPQ